MKIDGTTFPNVHIGEHAEGKNAAHACEWDAGGVQCKLYYYM